MEWIDQKILDLVEEKEFVKMWEKTTVCLLKLKTWYEVLWSSSCIDPNDYNREIWEYFSYRKALLRVAQFES